MRPSIKFRPAARLAARGILLSASCLCLAAPGFANETLSYTYDALGRLVQVDRATGPNNGMRACYTLDNAGNRTALNVGSGSCSGGGGGTGPSFSVSDVSATEGGSLSFTVTKSGTASGSTSVSWATAPGTATAGTDYSVPTPATLTFTTAQTAKTVNVTTTQDTVVEGNETLYLNLSNATGSATISDSQGIGTIVDDDSAATCSGVSYSITSGGAVTEGSNATFTIAKSGTHSGTCSVDYATANGTANAGSDYNALAATASFTSTQTTRLITVTTIDDTTVESPETFSISLTNAIGGATIGTASATGTINDNDSSGGACAGVNFTINDVTVIEGDIINFIVAKGGSSSSACGISYATSNGTASAGTHYTAKSGSLSFSSAQTAQTVAVTTVDLVRMSGNLTMYLNLSSATLGGVISDGQGKGTIKPSDAPCLTCLQSPPPEEPPEEIVEPEGAPE